MEAASPYVALLTRDRDDFVLVSDHPAIGILHWPHQSTLERSAKAAIKRLDDDVELRFGPGLSSSLIDEDMLSADSTEAYETVPGTERLPASPRTDAREGLEAQEEDSPTERVRERHRGNMRVVALGQVHAPNAARRAT